jgi:uncharacterized membrane protein
MKPLVVLISVFIITLAIGKLITGNFDYALAGKIAMSAMLLLTAFGHFKFADGMLNMLPSSIPLRKEIILFTGIIEIAAAIGLLIPALQSLTAWLLILFFILILPANISAALRGIDYQKGTTDGPGLTYLWFRIPLQIFFIAWVYYFTLYMR